MNKKRSDAHKGFKNGMWGKHLSSRSRKKLSLSLTGRIFSEEHKRKISESKKGHKLSAESKRNISLGHVGLTPWNKGKKTSKETRLKQSMSESGSKHYNWKGGITKENHKVRRSIEFRLWREAVFARDNYTCQKCGDVRGGNLNAHHIKGFAKYPNFRFAIDNGITLCKICHIKIHGILLVNKK